MSISLSTGNRVHRFSTSAYSIGGADQDEKGEKVVEGYLLKKGKVNTAYQNRYFVLYANNTLSYYQDATAIHEKPLGEISLYNVTEIKEEGTQEFHVITPKRTYSLKCEDKDELEHWLKKMKLRVNPNIICESWLFKKGEKNKSWKLRYFILAEFEMSYQVRYYEDEAKSKFKGVINCDFIDDVKILPNTSVQKYGKDKVLELVTEHRVYVIAGEDSKTRNLWYKSFKKVLFGEDMDKEREKERYKQQQMEQEREAMKLFDSLHQSQKLQQADKPEETVNTPVQQKKEKSPIAQPSIFVDSQSTPKSKSPAPFAATVATATTPDTNSIANNTKTNPFAKSFDPFVEKHVQNTPPSRSNDELFMDIFGPTTDEKETEDVNVEKPASNEHDAEHIGNERDSNQDRPLQSTNPFAVDETKNTHTNGASGLNDTLGTVSSVNDSKAMQSTLEHPLQPSSVTRSLGVRYMQDSMMSAASGTNGFDNVYDETNYSNAAPTNDSAVFSKQFIESEYESPNYQLIQDNDLDVLDERTETQKQNCCAKCVIL